MSTSNLPGDGGISLLGDHPFARAPDGKLKTRIATAFPARQTVVTLPGIHVTQRQAFVDHLDELRRHRGEPPLTEEEREHEWLQAVDLIVVEGAIQIRPDPRSMPLAFQADDLLQRMLAKHRIRFLGVLDDRVRDAVKRRGELWRITPLPKTPDEMQAMIERSRIGIGGREIYYYSEVLGTRYLTVQELEGLGSLDDEVLRAHLVEIARHLGRRNAAGNPEVAFFAAGTGISRSDFTRVDFSVLDAAALRRTHAELVEKFRSAVRPALQRDGLENLEWKNAMVGALVGRENELATEQTLLGLAAEFFMQIEWLPGGRMEEGELVLDPVLEDAGEDPEGDAVTDHLRDDKSRKFIFNLVREYGDLEFVNVGRVIGSLSRRAAAPGRRGVYIAAFKQRPSPLETVAIIRLQKQGVREYLEQGLPLLDAMMRAEEYTEYILDRRLGCRQLGMNLPQRVTAKKISEQYTPARGNGYPIWTPYFEREYIRGIATDKLAPARFESADFALRCARLLGHAAAPNIVVGRCDRLGNPLFDDGDEVLIMDAEGMPQDIVVSDHTGTFNEYSCPLTEHVVTYALPVTRRRGFLPDVRAFAHAYLTAFEARLRRIQDDYRLRRRAFDALFLHLPAQEPGSFAWRWKRVLARLDETRPADLADLIRGNIGL
ncbi:MAG TPA: hypothetical protein VMF68_16720 [Spirochaetia bacterium]|nr:hypothetical protein [Spirochaetia bacterium]